MTKKILWGIILFNIAIRLIHIDMPFLEGSSTRQIYNIMVAKTFFEERFNLLYPKIHINGNQTYYSALEMQFIPALAAGFYKVTDGVYPVVFRLISIFFTAMTLLLLYRFVSLFLNEKGALIATLFFGCSPINIYLGRSANFEMPMIFFNIATLYFFHQWCERKHKRDFIFSSLSLIVSVLLKIPNLYLLIPMAVMAFSKWRWRAWTKCLWLLLPGIVILTGQAWLHHLRELGPHEHWVHFNLAYNLKSMIDSVASLEFYKKVYGDILNYALTPLGLVFVVIGFLLKPHQTSEKMIYSWFLAVILFYLTIPETFAVHSYYHIHYLPIASFFVAKGFLFFLETTPVLSEKRFKYVITGCLILFVISSARFSISFYWIPDTKRQVLSAATLTQQHTPKHSLIVASVDSPVTLLYYADRKGWGYDFSDKGNKAIKALESFRSKGAQYFVSAHQKELKTNVQFVEYLKKNYTVLMENHFCLLIDLQSRSPS